MFRVIRIAVVTFLMILGCAYLAQTSKADSIAFEGSRRVCAEVHRGSAVKLPPNATRVLRHRHRTYTTVCWSSPR